VLYREAARDALWEELAETTRTATVRGVRLIGPPGIGRKTLLKWFVRRVAELGIARVVNLERSSLLSGVLGALNAGQRDVAAVRSRLLAQASGLDPRDLALLTSPAVHDRSRIPALLRLMALTADRPWVMLQHPSSPEGRAFVRWAARASELSRVPILVVAPGDQPDDPFAPVPARGRRRIDGLLWTELRLGPLPRLEIARILHRTLPIDRGVAGEIAEHVGGNPGFAMAVMRGLMERGSLTPGGRGFTLSEPLGDAPLGAISDVSARRVDRLWSGLSLDAQRSLEVAAMLGTGFVYRDWSLVCEALGIEASRSDFGPVVAAGLAVATPQGWWWTTAAARNAVAERARRRGWHRAIHQACADSLDLDHLALGHHLAESGREADAVEHWLLAANKLQLDVDFEAAEPLLARVRAVLKDRDPIDSECLRLELLEIQRLNSRGVAGLRRRAEALFDLAVSADNAHCATQAAGWISSFARRQGDPEGALQAILRSKPFAVREPHALWSYWDALGHVYTALNRPEDCRAAHEAAAEAVRGIDPVRCAVSNNNVAATLIRRKRAEEALPYARQAVRISPPTFGRIQILRATLALALQGAGRPNEAKALLHQALQAAERDFDVSIALFVLVGLLRLHADSDDDEGWTEAYERALQCGRALSFFTPQVAAALDDLVLRLTDRGDHRRARDVLLLLHRLGVDEQQEWQPSEATAALLRDSRTT